MKVSIRKLTMAAMLSSVALAISTAVVADVRVRLLTGNNFVVEDRTGGTDNLMVHTLGAGVEVPRGPLELKDGDASGTSVGKQKLFEGSGGGTDSVTMQAPATLAADLVFTLPIDDGEDGQVLQTDGNGVLSWVDFSTYAPFQDCDNGFETAIVDLVAGGDSDGRTWMDRNLGASQKSTAFNDSLSYGCLFQWGRAGDGHAVRTSATHAGSVASSVPGSGGNAWDGKFITNSVSPWDWLLTKDDTLWGDGTAGGITKGPNDPCPTGYQVPNQNELDGLSLISRADAFSTLALSAGGRRANSNGSVDDAGNIGNYWSSTVGGTSARRLLISTGLAYVNISPRALGMSVRCIKSL